MPLSIPQLARLSTLLEQALPLDEAGRQRWFAELPAGNEDLVSALKDALFPADGKTPGLQEFATLAKFGTDGVPTPVSCLKAGERVGPYELIRPLGTGGMAEVWLAQRADGAFKREVALKLPVLTRVRKDLEERFARERDILAGLEHPNIARLYDGGIDAQGLPYLAMEFVQGRPLTVWCDASQLPISSRIRLFLQVLDAVTYAHERHVIHRDIKPSNILVSDSGDVRLLDFGVAKLLEEDSTQPELTQVYGRALTPEYASPELLRGDAVDARGDVYSLGVLLYELLCGTRPYRIKPGASLGSLERAIETMEVERPSTRIDDDASSLRTTTSEKLSRSLRGDLDAIVLKALAKNPEERYGTAADLSEDLQRYLQGKPVKAQPARLTYRVRKYLLRNRAAIATTGAVVVLFATGYEIMQLRIERAKAESATVGSAAINAQVNEKSIAVLPFADMSEKHDQEYFSDGLSEELIERLARSPDLKVIARTSSFQFKGKNDDLQSIAAKLRVANILEGSVRNSGETLRVTAQLIRAADRTLVWTQTYDRSINDVFKIQDELAGKVVSELKARLIGTDAAAAKAQTNTAAYNFLLKGNFYLEKYSKDDSEKAIAFYRQAIQLDSRSATAWAGLAHALAVQAELGWKSLEEAMPESRRALDRALELDADLPLAHYTLALIEIQIDWDWAAARAEVERMASIKGMDALYLFRARADLALPLGDFDVAISNYRKVLDRDPLNLAALNNLGFAHQMAGRLEESLADFRELLQMNPAFTEAYGGIFAALFLSGKYAESLKAAEKVPDESSRYGALSTAYWALGRKSDSDAALAKLEKVPDADNYGFAQVRAIRGEIDQAFASLDRAYRKRESDMINVKADPFLRGLHNDPRFQALLVKLKLDGATQGTTQ